MGRVQSTTEWVPAHFGQTKPCGQRHENSAARHCSSVPYCDRPEGQRSKTPLRSILSGTAQRSWPSQPPAISQLFESIPPTSQAEVCWQSGNLLIERLIAL